MPTGIYDHSGRKKCRIVRICAHPDCNNTFEVMIDGWGKNQKYCSLKCSNQHIKPRNYNPWHAGLNIEIAPQLARSEEAKEKIGNANSKNLIGKKLSEETKQKIREANSGENSSSWKGGIANLPYSKDWTETLRESIRQRDNYICQLCGKIQEERKRLSIHHIDYDKKNCNDNNLITLCCSCNSGVNANREYWMEFFQHKLRLLERILL